MILKRRSFLGNLLTVPMVGNLFGWRTLLFVPEAPDFGAVRFVRLVNSLEMAHKCTGSGIKPLSALLNDPLSRRFMACKRSEKYGIGKTLASHLNTHDTESALPGWRTYLHCRDDGSDYLVAVLRDSRRAIVRSLYVSDSSGVIYSSYVPPDYSLSKPKSHADLGVLLKPVSMFVASNGSQMFLGLAKRAGLSFMSLQGCHNCIDAPCCHNTCQNSGQCYCYNCASSGCGWGCFPDCVSCILESGGTACTCC